MSADKRKKKRKMRKKEKKKKVKKVNYFGNLMKNLIYSKNDFFKRLFQEEILPTAS